MVDLEKAWNGLEFEQLDWRCGCGQYMALENPASGTNVLKCAKCGPIAEINLSLELVPSHEDNDANK